MTEGSEQAKELKDLKIAYLSANKAMLKAKREWLTKLDEKAPNSEWDDFYRLTQTKRRGSWWPLKEKFDARDFAAYLLHPPNGYLLPFAVLIAAMPLGVIAFHYQREAFIRFTCAGGSGQELLRIEKALGMKAVEGISSDSRIDHLCEKY